MYWDVVHLRQVCGVAYVQQVHSQGAPQMPGASVSCSDGFYFSFAYH